MHGILFWCIKANKIKRNGNRNDQIHSAIFSAFLIQFSWMFVSSLIRALSSQYPGPGMFIYITKKAMNEEMDCLCSLEETHLSCIPVIRSI